MSKTTEPAALAGIEPYGYLFYDKHMVTQFSHQHPDKYQQFNMDCRPIYSAATVERLVQERDGWIDSAREFSNGLEYYRDQLDACARHIGLPCFTADDGGVHEEPLRAKVTEEVQRLVQERDKYKDSVEHYGDLYAKLAAMTQERDEDRCRVTKAWDDLASMTGQRDRAIDLQGKLDNECEELTAQLAASQAREQQLREAIGVWERSETADELQGAEAGLIRAMNLLQDDIALRQWGAKLLREMADEYAQGAKDADKDSRVFLSEANSRCAIHLRRKADELEAVEDPIERARRMV